MDPRPSKALRRPIGPIVTPVSRTRPRISAERRTRSEPIEPVAPVCPAEVEARLAVLLRWM